MDTLLVTGGAGYIGSHTVRALTRKGYKCVVVDNLSYGHREAVENAAFAQVDLRDKNTLDAVFKQYGIDAVLHFAASSRVGESVENPRLYYENNVGGALNLLSVMLENGVRKIVFSSSCAVYGVPDKTPIDETRPLAPVSPYGQTKRVIEQILADYRAAYGLSYIALRYFNAAGASESGGIGESHAPETHLIPLVLQTILKKRGALSVFGADYPTPDGTCVRDYVHVDDLAQAHVLALEKTDSFAGALNLGTGSGASVMQIVRACEAQTGLPCPLVIGRRRAGDPPVLTANARKAKEILNWEPVHSSLENIVKTAWQWESNRKF